MKTVWTNFPSQKKQTYRSNDAFKKPFVVNNKLDAIRLKNNALLYCGEINWFVDNNRMQTNFDHETLRNESEKQILTWKAAILR